MQDDPAQRDSQAPRATQYMVAVAGPAAGRPPVPRLPEPTASGTPIPGLPGPAAPATAPAAIRRPAAPPPGVARWPATSADPMAMPGPPPAAPLPPPMPPPVRAPEKSRVPLYVIGGTVLVVLAAAVTALLSTGGPAPAHAATSAPRQAKPHPSPTTTYPAPSPTEYGTVLNEITAGDPRRITAVTEYSQYGTTAQQLNAATYRGWISAGLTIEQNQPTGTPSGLHATQTWELRRGATILATSTVTWHRRTPQTPWHLTQWPEFTPKN